MRNLLQHVRTFSWSHRGALAMSLAFALFAIGGALFQGAIPILGVEKFSLTTFQAGLIISSTGLIYILTDAGIGILIDRIGCRYGMLIGLLSAATAALLVLFDPHLWTFLVSTIFFSLSWNFIALSTWTYLLRTSAHNIAGEMFGIQGSLYVLGNALGAFAVGHVSEGGFVYSGAVYLLTTLAAASVLFFIKPREDVMHTAPVKDSYWVEWRKGFQAMRDFAPVSWVNVLNDFMMYTFGSAVWLVIPLSLSRFSSNLVPEGTAMGIFQISGIVTIFVGGYLADHHSRKKLFLLFLFLEILGIFALGVTTNVLLFLALAFFTTSIIDAADPVLNSMLSDVNPGHHNEGALEGFSGTLGDIGFIVGPLLGGYLLQFGLGWVFIALGILMGVNFLVSSWLLRNFRPTSA